MKPKKSKKKSVVQQWNDMTAEQRLLHPELKAEVKEEIMRSFAWHREWRDGDGFQLR